jgi:hypothetical protein
VRCAELILDRAHGKPAYLQDPDFVPLAERLKWYARWGAVDAAEQKVMQILVEQVRPPEGFTSSWCKARQANPAPSW